MSALRRISAAGLGAAVGRRVMRGPFRLLTLLLLSACSVQADAAQSLYQFTGSVTFATDPITFGMEIPSGTPVTGKFIFDPHSAGVPRTSGCDCQDYVQTAPNGFTARFGGALVWANGFVVGVGNDIAQPSGTAADGLSISFDNSVSPLLVNGVPHVSGQFSVNLLGSSALYPDAKLPTNISNSDYPQRLGVLSDTNANVSLVFSIDTLQRAEVLPGDYDLNGAVDGADMLVWQRAFGSVGTVGDGNLNGVADSVDLQVWSDHLASSVIGDEVGAIPVPEPSGWGSLAWIGALAAAHRLAHRLA